MTPPLRLMAILAHPDDETLAVGSTLARYAAEGVQTFLVTATRGECGWQGPPADDPGPEALGQMREAELRAAAEVLGVHEVCLLGYMDGDLDRANPAEATGRIAAHLRRIRPQVVVTFGPEGAYGHPDHIAISQLALTAVLCAADASYVDPEHQPAHRVAKFYFVVSTPESAQAFIQATGSDITMDVDGVVRGTVPWPEWAITTRVDSDAYWRTAWQAWLCHASQRPSYGAIDGIIDDYHRVLLGEHTFYRVLSAVNGGRSLETDLFAGLKDETQRLEGGG